LVHFPCLEKTPQFLADTKYSNPSDSLHCPFQIAHQTDLPAFVWALGRPKLIADFQLWMSILHDKQNTWLDAYDFSKHCESTGAETVVFVDVAGGIGQQCALLKQKMPNLKGRVILQDLQVAIDHAMPTPGVENTVIDMWEGQPVKGKMLHLALSTYLYITNSSS
jgi:demethylsterigmatocystin 6-O-methyltransferase